MREHTPITRLRQLILSGSAVLTLAITPFIAAPVPAQADPVVGFNPGNIISDTLFYNGNAMSASEIQDFLNQRLATCRIGTPPYLPGAKSPSGSGNIIANGCLKNYRQTTSSRAADAYCNGYSGAANETAAQIIAKVGKACGISQKVLLVMLQKEQSLVTDDWPVTRQYNYALGMNCPDSGPGNSANCNSASAGFSLQLYLGARQLKVYKSHPHSFNYQPFSTNTIKWHPNSSCGTSQVYIENWATAALYTYTPYRPNQAALNAGWGTGDACSAYGNRNFYNFYKAWFGNTQGFAVTGNILDTWNRFGGANGKIGLPTQNAQYVAAHGGGYVQEFTRGVIFSENRSGTSTAMQHGPFLTNYQAAGYVEGAWGWPTGDASCELIGGGCTMPFQNGVVAYTAASGSQLIPKQIVSLWNEHGGTSGQFGYPSEPAQHGSNASLAQKFAGGYLTWSSSGGAQPFDARFVEVWLKFGGVASLGTPVKHPINEIAAHGGGTAYELTRGTVWTSPAGTFAMTYGPFRTGYLNAGGPTGSWGWPTADAACGLINGGCSMHFQHGVGVWSAQTGMVLVSEESFEKWNHFKGQYGYPVKPPTQLTANGGGEVQEFTRGTVWTSPAGTFAMTYGPFRTGYLNAGGPTGSWGWPTADAICTPDSCTMEFQHGTGIYEHGSMSFVATQTDPDDDTE